MTINTLFQARRQLGLEEQLHNLNGLLEQIAYRNAVQIGMLPLIISDSTALGSGQLGNVVRQLDYYSVTEEDLSLARQQLQALSTVGLPMVGVRFDNKISSDKVLAKKAILTNMYQTGMSIFDDYDIPIRNMTIAEIIEFNQLIRVKYSFLAYMRTQVFRQLNEGTPFIRPLFFDFGSVDVASSIGTQYMFGPSIISCPGQDYSTYYFPNKNNSVWCTVRGGLSMNSVCFNDTPSNATDGRQNVFMHEGTITPLYSYTMSPSWNLSRSDDLMQSSNYSLDLHVFNDFQVSASYGELLIDGPDAQDKYLQFCYLGLRMTDNILTVEDLTASKGGSPSAKCSEFRGYDLKFIYVYDPRFANATTAFRTGSINNQINITYVEAMSDPNVGAFRVEPYGPTGATSIHIYNIQNVTFAASPAPV